jgi:hypothetical protein
MTRRDSLIGAFVLVASTFLLTEWVHYRVGTPPIFQLIFGPGIDADGASATKNGDIDSVTESEFQTYLHVLEAMQSDRTLSIEDAVEAEHLPLATFRALEQRVQRNEVLIDRARHVLRERAETLWNERGAPRDHG